MRAGTNGVVDVDARVNDVGAGALAGALVVDVRGFARCAVRDAGQAPGDVSLRDEAIDGDDGVLLNVFNLVGQLEHTIRGKKRRGMDRPRVACSRHPAASASAWLRSP